MPLLLRTEKLAHIDLRATQEVWPFSILERQRIDAAWRKRVEINPTLWNGRVLIARDVKLELGCLSARMSETDYASFIVWRDLGWPDKNAFNIFAMGVLQTVDGALVYGEMNDHTYNAGQIYPPGGSLEPRDILADQTVSLDTSISHEVFEEIGKDLSACQLGLRHAIVDGQRIAVVQTYACNETFQELQKAFKEHVHGQEMPELRRLIAIRSTADISIYMPKWAQEVVRLYCDK